jgi:hypothetical protein
LHSPICQSRLPSSSQSIFFYSCTRNAETKRKSIGPKGGGCWPPPSQGGSHPQTQNPFFSFLFSFFIIIFLNKINKKLIFYDDVAKMDMWGEIGRKDPIQKSEKVKYQNSKIKK